VPGAILTRAIASLRRPVAPADVIAESGAGGASMTGAGASSSSSSRTGDSAVASDTARVSFHYRLRRSGFAGQRRHAVVAGLVMRGRGSTYWTIWVIS